MKDLPFILLALWLSLIEGTFCYTKGHINGFTEGIDLARHEDIEEIRDRLTSLCREIEWNSPTCQNERDVRLKREGLQ